MRQVTRLAAGMLVLATAIPGAEPRMPKQFWGLPPEVRQRATRVFSAHYRTGRGPCELLPDGRRRWALLTGFVPDTVYRGHVQTDYIGIGSGSTQRAGPILAEGRRYLLLLRPSRGSRVDLRRTTGSRHPLDVLSSDEVLAIVEE